MYSLYAYGQMIADRSRVDAFRRALRSAIAPGAAVLDIGSGCGIMTLAACEAGARVVYAIEPDPILQVARELIQANGFADRVQFFEDRAENIRLPEQVDVIVSDLRGALPFHGTALRVLSEVRNRHLKPGGRVIAVRDTLWVSVASAPADYQAIVGPWEDHAGFDGSAGRARAVNTCHKVTLAREGMLTPPVQWHDIDYRTRDDVHAHGTAEWIVARGGQAHGLVTWFDCETGDGGFSNAPGAGEARVYGQVLLPWPQPQTLEAGDRVTAELRATLVGEDYVWNWTTRIERPGGPQLMSIRQSTFLATPFSAERLRTIAASHVPVLNQAAAVDEAILDAFTGRQSLEAVARLICERFPQEFPDLRSALTRVAELSARYSQ